MRVSTKLLQMEGIQAILNQQANVLKLQEQVATGKKLLAPADDPAGAARTLDLRQAIDTTSQFQDNILFARQRLQLEEGTLDSTSDVLQRVRELTIQANNDTLSDSDREIVAAEIRQRLDEMLGLANTQDANGEYIFAGYQGNTRPFTPLSSGGFVYNGDSGERFVQISDSRQISIGNSGTEVFRDIPNGNGTFVTAPNAANTGTGVIDPGSVTDISQWDGDTYRLQFLAGGTYQVLDSASNVETTGTYQDGAAISFNGIEFDVSGTPNTGDEFTISPSSSQDIFTTLETLAIALESGTELPADTAAFHNTINQVLEGLTRADEKIVEVRATIGARLNAVDTQETTNEAFTISMTETLSNIEDVDLVEAISLLQQQLVGLEAAQQTYAQVQGLSLFDFIR